MSNIRLLDGPAKPYALTVGTGAVVEVINTTRLEDCQVVSIQPLNGDIWVYFSDGSVPNVATVQSTGFLHFKKTRDSYEAGPSQRIFILSVSVANNSVRIAERA